MKTSVNGRDELTASQMEAALGAQGGELQTLRDRLKARDDELDGLTFDEVATTLANEATSGSYQQWRQFVRDYMGEPALARWNRKNCVEKVCQGEMRFFGGG